MSLVDILLSLPLIKIVGGLLALVLGLYVLVRVATAAYFQSRAQYEEFLHEQVQRKTRS